MRGSARAAGFLNVLQFVQEFGGCAVEGAVALIKRGSDKCLQKRVSQVRNMNEDREMQCFSDKKGYFTERVSTNQHLRKHLNTFFQQNYTK